MEVAIGIAIGTFGGVYTAGQDNEVGGYALLNHHWDRNNYSCTRPGVLRVTPIKVRMAPFPMYRYLGLELDSGHIDNNYGTTESLNMKI